MGFDLVPLRCIVNLMPQVAGSESWFLDSFESGAIYFELSIQFWISIFSSGKESITMLQRIASSTSPY